MVGFIMNKKDWEAIPEKYKPALIESIKRAENQFIADQKKMDAEYLKRCSDGGCTIYNPTAAEEKIWENSFKSDLHFMCEGTNPVVNKEFYDKIAAFLKEYRGE